mmetsp:Transcript_85675/g.239893  ORF Transcript_85675/g.239893 Transcript_85675/m.239893 type:complete len:737 (+) Transcript_85675:81-2291(+)
MSSSACHVTLRLGVAETAPGEGVVVVGGHHALGNWDPVSGLKMSTDEASYPVWSAAFEVPATSSSVEYKYVVDRRAHGEGFAWEDGENRRFAAQGGAWEQRDEAFGVPGSRLVQVAAPKAGEEAAPAPPAHTDDLPTTTEGSEASPEEKSMASEPHLVNVPSTVSMLQGAAMQRLASLSAFDQLVDDADQMAALRTQMEDEAAKLEDRPVRYGAKHLSTPIVIVSSEMHPWSKTGGLAMIAGSYGYEFALRGHRTMAIAPMYDDYAECVCIGSKSLNLAGGWHDVRYFLHRKVYGHGKVCDYVFVDHPCFRRSEGIYGPPGAEYTDNLFRFALLSLAAAEAPLVLEIDGSTYGQDVLFICNDWQTGILPVYLLYKYKLHNTYMNARSWMVIHNIAYQGKYCKERFPVDSYLGLKPKPAGDDLQGEDMHLGPDCINLLAGGIRTADRVLTVSPNYANEIRSPEGGNGLHEILQRRGNELRLAGILNGISDEWSPATDPKIPRNYRLADVTEGKRVCKAALQKELGLQIDPDACLIGFCGRLCYQKGLTLISSSIDWMMHGQPNRCQLIIMGKGEPSLAEQVAEAERRFKGRICGYVGFDPCVERRMMGGCDLLLMPSQFEPCGLPQMYAQMYGTLPVVHETGGLKDSVKGLWDDSHIEEATGFLFGGGFNDGSMKHALYTALDTFHNRKQVFTKMQSNAMKMSFYWPTAMDEYEKQVDWTMEGWPSRKPESWWSNHN